MSTLLFLLICITFVTGWQTESAKNYQGVIAMPFMSRALLDTPSEPLGYKMASELSHIKSKEKHENNPETVVPEEEKGLPDISEFKLMNDSHGYALITWTHFDSKVLYVLTCNKVNQDIQGSYCHGESNIYRSTDYGTTFTNERVKFCNNSQISAVYTSPTDRNVVQIFDQKNRQIYSSNNEGDTFNTSDVSFIPLSINFHPGLSNYILVKDTMRKVYITNNTGKNWYFVSAHVINSFWAYDQQDQQSEVFLEIEDFPGSKFPIGNYSALYTAKIPFAGHVQLFSNSLGPIFQNSLSLKKDYIFIWRRTSSGNSRLFASYKRRPFKECLLPVNELHTKFHIIDTKEGEIMLAALNESGWTNLFISDITGTKFSLALNHVQASWISSVPIIDLHIVGDLPGTLLANQVKTGTLISYNKGGSWSSLTPSTRDYKGQDIDCLLPDCTLQLSLNVRYSFSAVWSPITSTKSVPGVIVAQGYLHYKSDGISRYLSTYISTDGGQTWKQSLKGRQAVKLLDYGGIIAAIPFLNEVFLPRINQIDYSCDGGSAWKSAILSNEPKQLVGVAAHPSAKSNIITIFAVKLSSSKKLTWSVWRVNFTTVFDHKCYPENYTLWTASSNAATGACVLGQRYEYKRRKNNICCYNGFGYNPLLNISKCECTVNDFRCDYGFKRENLGSLCVPTSFAVLSPPVNCPEGGNYIKSKGYVKVNGDKCEGGVEDDIRPVTVQCPARAPDGLSLSVKKYSVALGKSSIIILHQTSGFLGTSYTWDFGDSVKKFNLSYEEARIQNHTYQQVGTYIIELSAVNKAGSYLAKTILRVIERVSEVFLDVTKPVVVNEEAIYTVTVKSHGEQIEHKHGFVHFVWIFEPIKTPVLSLNSSVKHTYLKTGTYEVEAQVFNAISVVSTTVTVTVFGDVRVIRLEFSSTLDILNNGQPEWSKSFKLFIYDYLIRTFKIRKEMVEVDVSKTLPTIVTLSLVQNKVPPTVNSGTTPTQSIDDVMHAIVNKVKSKKITFFLLGQEIRVLSATIIRDKKPTKKKIVASKTMPAKTKRYLYIGVPVGAVFLFFLICCCCKFSKRRFGLTPPKTYLHMEDENDQSTLQQLSIENSAVSSSHER